MLSTTTGHLAVDAALPARDVLLDAPAVADRLVRSLGRHGPLDIGGCELVRVKYRIGESLRVVYRIYVGGERRLVAARAFPVGASARAYGAAITSAVSAGDLRPVLHDPALDAVWWTFPNDRRLRGLGAIMQAAPSVSDLLPGDNGRWRASEVAEYAPERSATFRCTDEGGSAVCFAKVYAPGTLDVRRLAARYELVAAALACAALPVSAPRPLVFSTADDLLLLRAMPGTGWGDLSAPGAAVGLGRLGAAIATLHGVDWAPIALPRFARLDPTRVQHSAALIGEARPDVALAAAELARRLASTRPAESAPVLLHGDCHPKNALLDGDRVALIDLDQAGHGSPAADVGSLLARLQHDVLLGEHDGADAGRLAAAFLAGYAAVRALPSAESLRWHTAAALLVERAMRAVNRVHRPALARLDDLLATADHCLKGKILT